MTQTENKNITQEEKCLLLTHHALLLCMTGFSESIVCTESEVMTSNLKHRFNQTVNEIADMFQTSYVHLHDRIMDAAEHAWKWDSNLENEVTQIIREKR